MAEISTTHVSHLLTYAVQHAKGKQPHLVADVCDIVGRYSNQMKASDAGFLVEYIEGFVQEEEASSKVHWLELLRVLNL